VEKLVRFSERFRNQIFSVSMYNTLIKKIFFFPPGFMCKFGIKAQKVGGGK